MYIHHDHWKVVWHNSKALESEFDLNLGFIRSS